MQNAESHARTLFFAQLKAHSPYQLVPKPRMCPPHPQLDWGAKFLQEGIHVNLCFQLVVQPGMRPCIEHSTVVGQKPGSPSHQLKGPRQSLGVHHPNSRAHTKVWESMVKMSKKKK